MHCFFGFRLPERYEICPRKQHSSFCTPRSSDNSMTVGWFHKSLTADLNKKVVANNLLSPPSVLVTAIALREKSAMVYKFVRGIWFQNPNHQLFVDNPIYIGAGVGKGRTEQRIHTHTALTTSTSRAHQGPIISSRDLQTSIVMKRSAAAACFLCRFSL